MPRVSEAPGFVTAHSVRVEENQATSIAVFESEDAARRMADEIVTPPPEAVAINSVNVGEVVAHA